MRLTPTASGSAPAARQVLGSSAGLDLATVPTTRETMLGGEGMVAGAVAWQWVT